MAAGLLLPLLLAAAPPPGPVGVYRLRGEQDVASELAINRDGTFDYVLAAGALDEHARGRWRRVGNEIRLTTFPKPVPPTFAAGPARKEPGPLVLHVTWPDGRDAVGTDVRLDFAGGPPLLTYVGGPDGWTMPAEEARKPVAVTLALPMFGFVSPRFPVDVDRANALSFVITPHDLGRVDFEDLPLEIGKSALTMRRQGARLDYVRVR